MFIYSRIDSRIDLMKEISKSFDFDLATKRIIHLNISLKN